MYESNLGICFDWFHMGFMMFHAQCMEGVQISHVFIITAERRSCVKDVGRLTWALDRNELQDSGTSLQLPDSFGQGGKRKRGRKLMPNRKESGNQYK